MADALASGASGGNPVEVQVLSAAPIMFESLICGRGGIGRHAALRGQCSQGHMSSSLINRTIILKLNIAVVVELADTLL